MRPIFSKIRQKVRDLVQNKLSSRKIATECGISQSMVQKIKKIKKIKKISQLKSPNLTGGCPKLLTKHDERALGRYIMSGEASTASGAAKTLESRTGIKVSEWTASRALRDVGYLEKEEASTVTEKY